jgi:hypothetical protein
MSTPMNPPNPYDNWLPVGSTQECETTPGAALNAMILP